ncbi:flagellar export protein FliJ [Silvimonas iriomotensis]|uniref:Flagellar FliJ protein n=1 Tax=Silvimonas iriomotensis TaxID=449662 RepID=A0ABQ2P8U9_9NEIS|nr:flagellar export protein FliJ [Silvimonas iriomotensis]GGP20749.1 flagellar FliJ protein [Silvimonas iriomotensis]
MAQFRFAFLLTLSREQREEAARLMQSAAARTETARQKLIQVEDYRSEYRARLTQSGQGGMTVTQWRDFQLFLGRLDEAAAQQMAEVERLQREYDKLKGAWQECEKKVKAFETLETRHNQNEIKREARQEQKLVDEFNMRPRSDRAM